MSADIVSVELLVAGDPEIGFYLVEAMDELAPDEGDELFLSWSEHSLVGAAWEPPRRGVVTDRIDDHVFRFLDLDGAGPAPD